jgi:hypothetical protein
VGSNATPPGWLPRGTVATTALVVASITAIEFRLLLAT